MKRVVSASFITLLILVAVAATFFYLKNERNKGGNPVIAIPADVTMLITYNSSSGNLIQLLKSDLWPVVKTAPLFAKLEKQLNFFDTTSVNNKSLADFLSGQPLFITGHVTGAGKFDFLFLKSLDNGFSEKKADDLLKSLSKSETDFVKRNYDGNSIREIILADGKIFSYVTSRGIFIASFTPFLVEDALRQMKLGKPVITNTYLLNELRAEGKTSLFINFRNLPLLTGIFLNSGSSPRSHVFKNYGDWAMAAVDPQQQALKFSGYLTVNDSGQFINCFNKQQPVAKELLNILPRKTAAINYIGTSDFKSYYSHLSNHYFTAGQKEKKQELLQSVSTGYKLNLESKMLEWIGNEYALVITEPAGSNYNNNSFAIFKTQNIAQAKKSLHAISKIIDKKNNTITKEESYNGHAIGFIRLNGVIPALFGETFSAVNKMYYTDIQNYIVIANQASALRTFIDEYKSGLLLHKTEFFKEAMKNYPGEANHFFFVRPPLASQIFKSMANAEWKKYSDQYKDIFSGISSIGFQVTAGDTMMKMTSVLNFFRNKSAEGVDLIFAVETDTSVSMKPLVTTDPVSKSRQLIFQDNASNIYLTDNSGNIIWKQPVDGRIMGEIFEIDLFKNNSRQFLFNTAEYMYLFDTQGSPVGNFPIRLPAEATNGLAVFDFDKNRDFKIYVACDNRRIYAYLPSGKPLPGWNFQYTLDKVVDPVRSIEVNSKHILLITDQTGKVAFVNRYGEQGIPVGSEFTQARNSGIFKTGSGSLITTDAEGNIIEIRPDGIINSLPLKTVSPEHGFLYADADGNNEPDYIFLDGRELIAYNSQLAMIFRKEFDSQMNGTIQLLTIKNGEHVMGVRSDVADKTWLIKMNGSVYNGFPVKGSTPILIDEMNMDGHKHLVTGGKENLLYVYSIE